MGSRTMNIFHSIVAILDGAFQEAFKHERVTISSGMYPSSRKVSSVDKLANIKSVKQDIRARKTRISILRSKLLACKKWNDAKVISEKIRHLEGEIKMLETRLV